MYEHIVLTQPCLLSFLICTWVQSGTNILEGSLSEILNRSMYFKEPSMLTLITYI